MLSIPNKITTAYQQDICSGALPNHGKLLRSLPMRNDNKQINGEVELGVWDSQNLLTMVLCDPVEEGGNGDEGRGRKETVLNWLNEWREKGEKTDICH